MARYLGTRRAKAFLVPNQRFLFGRPNFMPWEFTYILTADALHKKNCLTTAQLLHAVQSFLKG
jgi:hypothetical protein